MYRVDRVSTRSQSTAHSATIAIRNGCFGFLKARSSTALFPASTPRFIRTRGDVSKSHFLKFGPPHSRLADDDLDDVSSRRTHMVTPRAILQQSAAKLAHPAQASAKCPHITRLRGLKPRLPGNSGCRSLDGRSIDLPAPSPSRRIFG